MGKVTLNTQVNSATEEAGNTLSIKAQQASTGYAAVRETVAAPALHFDLLPSVAGSIVPGSVIFSFGGAVYLDRSGIVYSSLSHSTNAGIAVGTIDYDSRSVVLTSFPPERGTELELLSCLVSRPGFAVTSAFFRTPGAPLRPASMQISAVVAATGEAVTATADLNGNISSGIIQGRVDSQTGITVLRFTSDVNDLSGESEVPVIPSLLRYNAVVQTLLPLDSDLIGLDPVRLPADGRVPVVRTGDVVVLHNTLLTDVPGPVPGGSIALDRGQVSAVEVLDPSGKALLTSQYSVDKEAGVLTWANPLVLQDEAASVLDLPLTIYDRVEHMALVTEAQITGQVSLSSEVPWDLPAEGTFLSSAVTWGDLQARVHNWFTQQTWNSSTPNWTDLVSGGTTTAQYNSLAYPPLVANMGTVEGRWALVFTSAVNFNIVEEKLGVVSTGSTGVDCSPINPMTNTPYFTIKADGWGSGWASGNVVRFNTTACLGPMWVARTVIAGKGVVDDDSFGIQVRGDAD